MYFLNTEADQQAMLAEIGVSNIDQLFESIPAGFRLNRPLNLPLALGELALTGRMKMLAGQNWGAETRPCFLGAGSYDHFIPAVVDFIAARSEFYTSYTPYQPEASQGNLQVMFEYQGLVSALTGMDVSNASLYEGASAVTEAALLSLAATGRRKIVLAESVHPEYRQTLATYLAEIDAEIVVTPCLQGQVDPEALSRNCTNAACFVVQHPNFFGCLENVRKLSQIAHDAGALVIGVVDPISLGLLERPGSWGADIAVCEGQSLGNPLSFGGPYLGMMASKESFVRRLPGRIAGQTVDREGRRCWVLTLQTREQHIRREKATSNICTNQGLLALRASVYLACMGPRGLKTVAEHCVRKAAYAAKSLTAAGRFRLAFNAPFFKEFTLVDTREQESGLQAVAEEAGLLAGISLHPWYSKMPNNLLVAVTEKRSKEEIDQLTSAWK